MSPKAKTKRPRSLSKSVHVRQAPRRHPVSFLLNEDEKKLLSYFFDRYKLTNKSEFLRKTVLCEVLRQLNQDYPAIFEDDYQ